MLTDMPVGCQVPISDSSSGVYLYQPVNGSTRIDPEDATDGHLNPASLARSSPAALTSNTPASTSDQPRASSPLLPYHYNPVKRDGTYQGDAGNRRISDIGNESNFESLDLVHSSKGIKKLIGPWNLGTTLGEGATGRVRKARHIITGQVAAVKIMSKRVATVMRSQSVLQMDNKIASRAQLTSNFGLPFGLEREIVIMKLIIHPNITKLYDLWENRGEIYLVLEYVDGGELFKYIVDQGSLYEMEAMRIFRQILSAISYCHMFRLCHRDIKPENILMDRIGNIKLADFGMATREHVGGLTTSCGSPHYAPPEIACGENYVGSQVDIWSCGVVLYVMIAGALPFGNYLAVDDIEGVLREIANVDPKYHEEISDDAVDLLMRMLDKNPSSRITADLIWHHPLVDHYGQMGRRQPDAHRWIGDPPKPLTTDDCGSAMERSGIDRDVLSSLCTLWHSVEPEEIMERLMEDKPNYEKVIFKNLVQFRIDQEENYLGVAIEHADSDVHHVHQRTIRTQSRVSLSGSTRKRPLSADYSGSFPTSLKSVISRSSLVSGSNRSDLLGARKRPSPDDSHSFAVPSSSSRFTIATPAQARGASSHSIAPNSSQASRQTSHKSKSTERSYDPYRASSADTSIPVADHSKITIIENSSMGSRNGYAAYTASLRHPAVQRLHSDQYSTAESIPSDAREFAGNRRSLRRSKLRRESSSSSWASTGLSSSSFRQFPVSSLRHKRIVQITNPRNRSPPPPRPRNPTPGTIRDKYLQDDSSSSGSLTCPASDLNVKKRSPFVDGDETNTKAFTMVPPNNVDRSSILWEERTRQASLELSTLMDEVFFESKIESALWSVKTEEEKHEEFVRRSFDLPGLRGTGYHRPLPNLPLIKAETPQPSSDHTKMRSLYDADSVEELTRVKILLETRARDLDTSSLDPVIGHLNRLLQETPNSRRVWSAPEQSRDRDMASSLSPVREDDEPRLVSNPVKGINGKIEKSTFDGNRSTVRLVHNEDTALFPAPLKIKKKSSMPFLSSTDQYVENEEPQEKKTPQGRLKFGTSTSALDRIFKRDANKSGMLVGSDKTPSKGSPLRRSNGTPLSKGLTDDTEGKNWFRRSQASSHDSGSAKKSETSESRGSNYHPKGNTTNAPEDEFSFRLPKAETIASRCLRFFKGKPKEKRMQIAMPDVADGAWYESPPKPNVRHEKSRSRNVSRATLRSNLQEPTSSRGINRRNSSFALPSSPHLYKAPVTYEPYIQPSGTTHLLARLLNIQIRQTAPTPQLFCLQLPRISAIQEIRSILRDWRRYGLYNVRVNQEAGTVRATVSEDNGFDMKPVSLVATIHAVAVDGNAGGLSIVKVTAEWGNRNSFQKACEALNVVLRDRNLIVMSRHVAREMKAALRDWEKM